jgi:serine/threonine protein phosphatase PrpC
MSGKMKKVKDFFNSSKLTVNPYLNGVTYPVSYWTEVGGRPYQEDRFHAMKAERTELSLYGVFDGHGGYKAAQYCKEYLLQSIAADPEVHESPSKVISRSFKQ